MSSYSFFPALLLLLTLISVCAARFESFIKHRPLYLVSQLMLCLLLILVAMAADWLAPLGVLPIILLVASCLATNHFKTNNLAYWPLLVLTAVLSLALALHLIPGFHNPVIFEDALLGESSSPFTLRLGVDKLFVGVALLAFLPRVIKSVLLTRVASVVSILIGLCAIYAVGISFGLSIDIKFNDMILAFLAINLLVTCVAEEAFFRLLVQDNLQRIMGDSRASVIAAVVITSLVFLIAHTGFYLGPSAFVIGVASLVYAAVYAYTRSIYVAILTHFLANAIHIVFFTYPMAI